MLNVTYNHRKVTTAASQLFFAKYYDDLQDLFSSFREVYVSFDHGCVALACDGCYQDRITLSNSLLQLCNTEKIICPVSISNIYF